jgi:hypothetical protein
MARDRALIDERPAPRRLTTPISVKAIIRKTPRKAGQIR